MSNVHSSFSKEPWVLNYFKKMTCITHTCAWSQKEHWQVKGFIEDTLSKFKKYKEVNVYMLYRRKQTTCSNQSTVPFGLS